MTVEVERSFAVDAPITEAWDLLSDEENRARAIDVVERYELRADGVVWHVRIPIPLVDRTVAVKTRDLERDPPRHVKFAGQSKVMTVTGEHDLTEVDGGCRVDNRFVVDGKVPGVERFFERNFDDEIENIKQAVSDAVADVEET